MINHLIANRLTKSTFMKAHSNSEPIAIIATNIDGIIYQFNKGAEVLFGYAASEIIGLQKINLFLIDEEIENFKKDIASRYNQENSVLSSYQLLAQNNDYDSREWTVIKKDGTNFIAHSTITAIKSENGEGISFISVIRDITIQKELETDLIRKNQALNAAEKITLLGHWEWNIITNDVNWSSNVYKIFEVDPIVNLNFETYIGYVHPDDKDSVNKFLQKSIKDKLLPDLLHRIITTSGKTKIVELTAELISDDEGNIIELIGTCQDVTEKRMAETKFIGLLESAPDAMVIVDADKKIHLINKEAEKLFGYSSEELINQPVEMLIPERYKEEGASGLETFFATSKTRRMGEGKELYGLHKNGKEIPIQISLSPIKTEEGIFVSTAVRDITIQKGIETDLLRKNQVLNAAEKITMMGNWQWDTVKNQVTWSSNLFNIFEVDPKENLNFDSYFNFVHSDDKQIVSQSFDESINDKKFYDLLHRIISTSGKTKTIQLLGEVITDNEGKVIELIGTCQDVTQQRMAEIKFKGLLESAPDAMVIVNEYGEIQLINKQSEKLFGYTPEELTNTAIDILIPDSSNYKHLSLLEMFRGLSETKKLGLDKELYAIDKNDKEIPIQISISPLLTVEGLLISIAIRDITIQKDIETDLLRKNHILNKAEKLTKIGSWQWNTITRDVIFSSNLYAIFEIDLSEKLTFDTYLSFVHPEDKEMVDLSIAKSIQDNIFHELLHRIVTTSGITKTVQIFGELMSENEGQVIEFMGTCQDVTQQRMAEIKFKGLLESAPDAMVIVNEDGIIQLINKQSEKLFGYAPKELINKPVEILIPESTENKHITHRYSFFNTPKARGMGEGKELYGLNKKGEKIPIQISLSPLKTEEGLLVSAAIRDITIQKKAENKILEAKESLEILANKLTFQNTQLADFAHITSHNLRAPVSNLNTLLEFYKTSETEDEREMLFEKIEIVNSHLTETLNTLIQALRTKSEGAVELETLEFTEILNKTKEILTGQILETEAEIKSNFLKNPKIKYNRVYLESIFLNLLSNSIKYRSTDRKPEIFIESVVENGLLQLKFKDNGLGINLERHGNKLFGLNKVFHRHPDAKGVGLFMTKVQVESMGGEITVESEENVGSTFNINFNEEK